MRDTFCFTTNALGPFVNRRYTKRVVGARLCRTELGAAHPSRPLVQMPLFCALIELIDEGTPVVAPEDLVYSTQPRKATALDGNSYFVKGPDRNIVVAEAVAHQLAQDLDLNVPAFGIALTADGPLFASREVPRCQRQIETWLIQQKTVNPETLPLVLAFDIWTMNKDRNMGNLVGEGQLPPADGRVAIVAIDFEKAMTLRGPYPLTATPHIQPRALWPSGTLGQMVKGAKCPPEFLSRIEGMGEHHVLDAFARVEARLAEDIPWKQNSAQLLALRAKKIRALIAEVWR